MSADRKNEKKMSKLYKKLTQGMTEEELRAFEIEKRSDSFVIKINKMPAGPAPEWVRKNWIGLVMPASELFYPCAFSFFSTPVCVWGDESKKDKGKKIFLVKTQEALDTLATHSTKAVQWFKDNLPAEGDLLGFVEDGVEVLSKVEDEVPGLLPLSWKIAGEYEITTGGKETTDDLAKQWMKVVGANKGYIDSRINQKDFPIDTALPTVTRKIFLVEFSRPVAPLRVRRKAKELGWSYLNAEEYLRFAIKYPDIEAIAIQNKTLYDFSGHPAIPSTGYIRREKRLLELGWYTHGNHFLFVHS